MVSRRNKICLPFPETLERREHRCTKEAIEERQRLFLLAAAKIVRKFMPPFSMSAKWESSSGGGSERGYRL